MAFTFALSACGGSMAGSGNAPKVVAPAIIQPPSAQVALAGQPATFTVLAAGTNLNYQWMKNSIAINGATQANFVISVAAPEDNGSQFEVMVKNTVGSITSDAASLTVHTKQPQDVVTFHNDVERTGQDLYETVLSSVNINPTSFGLIRFLNTDGKVDGQPLYLDNVTIPGQGVHDVLYVVTEHDTVYAFDTDTGTQLWKISVLGVGEVPSDPRSCVAVTPEIGIAQTPVIDRTHGPNGTIYLVAMSKNSSGDYFQRLHALDITSGKELFGGPTEIHASYPGTGANSSGGIVTFDPKQYKERSSLLLFNNLLYLAWSSHCDQLPYTSWVMTYNPSTLGLVSVLNLTPNGFQSSIWSAAGLAADSTGNIYAMEGNGTFDTKLDANGFPLQGDYGNSFLKLLSSGGLQVGDYFATFDNVNLSENDLDFGSGAPLVLPDLTDALGHIRHLAVGAGKDSKIYVVDRDLMGKFNSTTNRNYQQLTGALAAGVYTSPAYFNGTVYFNALFDNIKAFSLQNAEFSQSPVDQTLASGFDYPGVAMSISANSASDGVLWAVQNASTTGVLHSYDAANLSVELYSGFDNPARDQFGPASKFIPPTIAEGKIYIASTTGVAVFGLLP